MLQFVLPADVTRKVYRAGERSAALADFSADQTDCTIAKVAGARAQPGFRPRRGSVPQCGIRQPDWNGLAGVSACSNQMRVPSTRKSLRPSSGATRLA